MWQLKSNEHVCRGISRRRQLHSHLERYHKAAKQLASTAWTTTDIKCSHRVAMTAMVAARLPVTCHSVVVPSEARGPQRCSNGCCRSTVHFGKPPYNETIVKLASKTCQVRLRCHIGRWRQPKLAQAAKHLLRKFKPYCQPDRVRSLGKTGVTTGLEDWLRGAQAQRLSHIAASSITPGMMSHHEHNNIWHVRGLLRTLAGKH